MFTTVMSEKRRERACIRVPEQKLLYYQAEMQNTNGETVNILNFIPANVNI